SPLRSAGATWPWPSSPPTIPTRRWPSPPGRTAASRSSSRSATRSSPWGAAHRGVPHGARLAVGWPVMDLPLVLSGRVVTFDEDQPVLDDGAVYIGADELIAAVHARTAPAPAGFDGARKVRTGGVIYPGLIDLHGHIPYQGPPLWSPPGRKAPYASRYQWPGARSYEGIISDPANALGALCGKAHL